MGEDDRKEQLVQRGLALEEKHLRWYHGNETDDQKQNSCAECGHLFSEYRPQHRFCSTRCRNAYHAKQRKRFLEFGKLVLKAYGGARRSG